MPEEGSDWSNRRWAKLYVDDSPCHVMRPWQARLVLYELVRKMHAVGTGVMDLGHHGLAALPLVLHLPADVTDVGVQYLLGDGTLVLIEEKRKLFWPKYHPAQTARSSDRSRAQEKRQRDRAAAALSAMPGSEPTSSQALGNVVPIGPVVDVPSQGVTGRHRASQGVTGRHDETRREEDEKRIKEGAGAPLFPGLDVPKPKSGSGPKTSDAEREARDRISDSYTEVHGHPYQWGGDDWKALRKCLELAGGDVAAFLARWDFFLKLGSYPGGIKLRELASRWDLVAQRHREGPRNNPRREREQVGGDIPRVPSFDGRRGG